MHQLNMYENYLKKCELSEQTCEVYLREAEHFLKYLNGRNVTKELALSYKKELVSQSFAPSTINLYVTAVNKYIKYIGCEDACIKTIRTHKKRSVENVINKSEYKELLAYARTSGREKYYYIMKTLALTGIRVSELRFITVETLKQGSALVYNKGKIREIYLPDKLIGELRQYCGKNDETEGTIFRGKDGAPINRTTVYKMMAYMGDMVGIEKEKVHPHSFRHFFAISYMERYGNLAELADILGHTNIETTRIYTASTVEEKRRRLNNLGL